MAAQYATAAVKLKDNRMWDVRSNREVIVTSRASSASHLGPRYRTTTECITHATLRWSGRSLCALIYQAGRQAGSVRAVVYNGFADACAWVIAREGGRGGACVAHFAHHHAVVIIIVA